MRIKLAMWVERLLYRQASGPLLENTRREALRWGKELGRGSCKRCKADLIEIEMGLFECPNCREPRTDPLQIVSQKTGDLARAWHKRDLVMRQETEQLQAIPPTRQRETRRLKRGAY